MDRRTVLRTGLSLTAVGVPGCREFPGSETATDTTPSRYVDIQAPVQRVPIRPPNTTGEPVELPTSRIRIDEIRGVRTAGDGQGVLGAVQLEMTKAPGTAEIDLSALRMQWVDDTGTYYLDHERFHERRDGVFAHGPDRDDDGSLGRSPPVLNGDDRATLTIDIGTVEETGAVSAAYTTEISSSDVIRATEGGLGPGESALLRLWTDTTRVRTVQLAVPASLA